jgi:hypothetical protein
VCLIIILLNFIVFIISKEENKIIHIFYNYNIPFFPKKKKKIMENLKKDIKCYFNQQSHKPISLFELKQNFNIDNLYNIIQELVNENIL